MKGVIVSAGLGTRLRPITNLISKNLLPIYNKPMIYYAIETLIKGGVDEILIVISKEHTEQYKKLLKNGEDFNINITYTIQHEQKGTAHAIGFAEQFSNRKKINKIFNSCFLAPSAFLLMKQFFHFLFLQHPIFRGLELPLDEFLLHF